MNGARHRRRRGFTIVEMIVTGFLMALVGILLGNAWAAFARPAITTVARCRVAQEANLAAEAIAYDIGRLARNADPQYHDSRYQTPRVQAGSPNVLNLTIDDGTTTVSYAPDPFNATNLVRTETGPGGTKERVVATLLGGYDSLHNPAPGFVVSRGTLPGAGPGGIDAPGVEIDMTFTHRTMDRDPVTGLFRGDYTRRYTLFIPDPQAAP